jgi:hypothetical protein
VKPQPPGLFTGSQRDCENFRAWVFQLAEYFALMGIFQDEQKIQYTGTLLRNGAATWFRTVRQAPNPITVWDEFVRNLEANFVPSNAAKVARNKLASLKQSGSAREYIREFRTLVLDIPNMNESEKLDKFTRDLKPFLRREVEMKDPTTFSEAVQIVEKLDAVSYSAHNSYQRQQSDTSSESDSDFDAVDTPSEPEGPMPMELNAVRPSTGTPTTHRFTKLTPELRAQLLEEGRCLYCRELGHILQECPKRPERPPPR